LKGRHAVTGGLDTKEGSQELVGCDNSRTSRPWDERV
jgi:hypothetical protein